MAECIGQSIISDFPQSKVVLALVLSPHMTDCFDLTSLWFLFIADYQSSSLSSSSEPPILPLRWFKAVANALAKSPSPEGAGADADAVLARTPSILGDEASRVSVFLRSLTLLP